MEIYSLCAKYVDRAEPWFETYYVGEKGFNSAKEDFYQIKENPSIEFVTIWACEINNRGEIFTTYVLKHFERS